MVGVYSKEQNKIIPISPSAKRTWVGTREQFEALADTIDNNTVIYIIDDTAEESADIIEMSDTLNALAESVQVESSVDGTYSRNRFIVKTYHLKCANVSNTDAFSLGEYLQDKPEELAIWKKFIGSYVKKSIHTAPCMIKSVGRMLYSTTASTTRPTTGFTSNVWEDLGGYIDYEGAITEWDTDGVTPLNWTNEDGDYSDGDWFNSVGPDFNWFSGVHSDSESDPSVWSIDPNFAYRLMGRLNQLWVTGYDITFTTIEYFTPNIRTAEGLIDVTDTIEEGNHAVPTSDAVARAISDIDIETTDEITEGSSAIPTSGAVYNALSNIEIDVDDELSNTSENPVQNRIITEDLWKKKNIWQGAKADWEALTTDEKVEYDEVVFTDEPVYQADTIDYPESNSSAPISAKGVAGLLFPSEIRIEGVCTATGVSGLGSRVTMNFPPQLMNKHVTWTIEAVWYSGTNTATFTATTSYYMLGTSGRTTWTGDSMLFPSGDHYTWLTNDAQMLWLGTSIAVGSRVVMVCKLTYDWNN